MNLISQKPKALDYSDILELSGIIGISLPNGNYQPPINCDPYYGLSLHSLNGSKMLYEIVLRLEP